MREQSERQEIGYGIAMVTAPTWFCMDRCILSKCGDHNYHAHTGTTTHTLETRPGSRLTADNLGHIIKSFGSMPSHPEWGRTDFQVRRALRK